MVKRKIQLTFCAFALYLRYPHGCTGLIHHDFIYQGSEAWRGVTWYDERTKGRDKAKWRVIDLSTHFHESRICSERRRYLTLFRGSEMVMIRSIVRILGLNMKN